MHDRLLPEGGIECIWKYRNTYIMKYVDVQDVTPNVISGVQSSYKETMECSGSAVNKGSKSGRTFRIYIFQNDIPIGLFNFWEWLDSPLGYGKDDFLWQKYITPEYRYTFFARIATSDVFHLVFDSDVMNRLYTCMKVKEEGEGFWDIVDKSNPFISKLYPNDGPNVQKYMWWSKFIIVPKVGRFGVMEVNGEAFKKMDLLEYHNQASPNVVKENWNEWYETILESSRKVKELHGSIDARNLVK